MSPRSSRGTILAAPFVILAGAAFLASVVKLGLDRVIDPRVDYGLGWWGGYAFFAAVFLRYDARLARELPDARWGGAAPMWRATCRSALRAVEDALYGVIMIGLLLAGLGAISMGILAGVWYYATLVAIGIFAVASAVSNVQRRRRTRLT